MSQYLHTQEYHKLRPHNLVYNCNVNCYIYLDIEHRKKLIIQNYMHEIMSIQIYNLNIFEIYLLGV